MPTAGFEPAVPTIKRPQTHALVRAATGFGGKRDTTVNNIKHFMNYYYYYYYYYYYAFIFFIQFALATSGSKSSEFRHTVQRLLNYFYILILF